MAAEATEFLRSDKEPLFARLQREPPLSETEVLGLLQQLVRAVAGYHREGRLHREISAATTFFDSASHSIVLAPPREAPIAFGGRGADPECCPAELCSSRVIELPVSLSAARARLHEAGIALEPQRIDIYQVGTLLCRMLTGESVEAYLRSPRVKAQISPRCTALLDRTLGHSADECFQSVDALAAALELTTAQEPTPADTTADTEPSLVSPTPGGDDTSISHVARPAVSDAALPFQKLGHYEVIGRLGRGGMGEVYRGYERLLDRPVALKVLPAHLARDESFVLRFYSEASAAARLVHPNIVQIYSIGEDQGHHYFAMQYVDGETLSERLARCGRLSVEETLVIVEQTLLGLAAAHARGLIHRDIKPGNILLEPQHSRVWLADFGLVKSLTGGSMTTTGLIMGTADYISPEQGRGKPVDARSDLYSMGALMFRMLSGRLPFQADSSTAMIFQHAYEPAPPLHDIAPDVPLELAQIVDKLLAKAPERRYGSANELLTDLKILRRRLTAGQDDAELREMRRQRTVIVEAPRFEEPLILPEALLEETPAEAPPRMRDRLLSLFRRAAPEIARELQSTQQQVDGAVAEFRARRDRLAALVAEAEASLRELQSLAAEYRREANGSAEAHVPQSQRESPLETAALLERQAAEQHEQLATMRIQLAKVEATLQQLQGRRDLLNARLKAAQAQIRLAGGKVAQPPWWTALRRLTWKRWAQFAVLAGAWSLFVYLNWDRVYSPEVEETTVDTRPNLTVPNVPTGPEELNWNLQGAPSEYEKTIAVSADSRWLVSFVHDPAAGGASMDEMKLWDLAAGAELRSLDVPHRSRAMAVSPDRKWLISAGSQSQGTTTEIKLWDLSTGQVRHTIAARVPDAHTADVGFSHDSRTAYSLLGVPTDLLGVIDVASGEMREIAMPHSQDQVTSIAVSPTDDLAALGIVTTRVNGRVAIDIHDLKAERLRSSVPLLRSASALTFSLDGRLLVGSMWGNIVVWQAPRWTELLRVKSADTHHRRLAVSPDGRFVAAVQNQSLTLWNLETQEQHKPFEPQCFDVAFSSGGTLIVVPRNSQFRFFDPETGRELLRPKL